MGMALGIALILSTISASALAGDPKVKAMTRNVYLGANIFRVVNAALDPNADQLAVPTAAAEVFQIVQQTNFPERAEALADEIALFSPDVIGLQEVSTYYIQTPSDYGYPDAVSAETVVYDFQAILNAALLDRGMHYNAYTVTNADIEVPMLNPDSPTYLSDIRMVDHDVILVRDKYEAANEIKGNFTYNLEVDLGAAGIFNRNRGYIAIDVNIKGQDYTFANTHLEVGDVPGSVFRVFQSAQMQELLTILSYSQNPTLLVGDFNSRPEDVPGQGEVPGVGLVPYVPPYMQALGSGYADTWLEQKKVSDGFTAGFDEFVSDETRTLTHRIDMVFMDPKNLSIEKVKAVVVGDDMEDMTPSGLWPSDHAGVISKIKLAR